MWRPFRCEVLCICTGLAAMKLTLTMNKSSDEMDTKLSEMG